jgi:hypothetical protein
MLKLALSRVAFRPTVGVHGAGAFSRFFCSGVDTASLMEKLLQEKLSPVDIKVVDVSGGCDGSSFFIEVTSAEFEGTPRTLAPRTCALFRSHGRTKRVARRLPQQASPCCSSTAW